MKNLFQAPMVTEVKERIAHLRSDSERQWGKMNAAQMVAHCSAGLELAMGDRTPPQLLLGRIIGWIVKPMASAASRIRDCLNRRSPCLGCSGTDCSLIVHYRYARSSDVMNLTSGTCFLDRRSSFVMNRSVVAAAHQTEGSWHLSNRLAGV